MMMMMMMMMMMATATVCLADPVFSCVVLLLSCPVLLWLCATMLCYYATAVLWLCYGIQLEISYCGVTGDPQSWGRVKAALK